MAIKIRKNAFKIDLGSVISRSIDTVKQVRSTEQARMEAEYQKAIANGLSYDAQLKFRQDQLDKEKSSSNADPLYITRLETSINDTKKLIRFQGIRDKYTTALNAYVVGKSSMQAYIDVLKDVSSGETDPEMQNQLKDLLSKAQQDQHTNEINAVKNRVIVAEKDKSLPLLDKSIAEVKDKRAIAAINKNEDEVAMWDESLLALTSSKSKLQVENSTNELTFKINKNNPKAVDKLGYLNDEINKADASAPLTYNGITYPSMKAYWEDQRGQYISNSFFTEIDKEITADTNRLAQKNKFGQIPPARIAAVADFYSAIATKPEFAPFADLIAQKKTDTITNMVTDLAKATYDDLNARAATTETDRPTQQMIDQTDYAISTLEKRFGVNVTRPALASENAAGVSVTKSVTEQLAATPVESAFAPSNAAEIKRAQDVYANADKLAGTGKYVGQTADQVRENAHNYANSIRSGKINLDTTTYAPEVLPNPATPIPTEPASPQTVPTTTPTTAPTAPPTAATTPTTGITYNGKQYQSQADVDAQKQREIKMNVTPATPAVTPPTTPTATPAATPAVAETPPPTQSQGIVYNGRSYRDQAAVEKQKARDAKKKKII